MKFDEIQDPKCDTCGAYPPNHYSATLDENGDVKKVVCGDCKDKENLARWDLDHRLYSSALVTAACLCYEGKTLRPGDKPVDPRWQEIHDASNRIHKRVKDHFEPNVWFGFAGQPFAKTPDPQGFGFTAGYGPGRARSGHGEGGQPNQVLTSNVREGQPLRYRAGGEHLGVRWSGVGGNRNQGFPPHPYHGGR